ncbi:replication initiator protein [Microviridae sp.]|nr:replication initiator protein [Microviridae sp.]
MLCRKGILLKQTQQRVPCGQCMPCRINTGRKWSGRIMLESAYQYTKTGFPGEFITLTYSDENVPVTVEGVQTLAKKPFLIWLHNQRKDLQGFRYYAVGEYGENTHRPHYHLALFPTTYDQCAVLRGRWEKLFGFTSSYPLAPERARYLANYTAKKLTKPTDDRLEPGQEPEFRTSSRKPPIAAHFIEILVSQYSTKKGKAIIEERGDIERVFRWEGRLYPIAPYLLNKARERLGIPLLESERGEHPNYYHYHQVEEALWDPSAAHNLEVQLNAKKIQRLYRSTSIKL